MRTQSIDTHPEVERILVERLRQGGVNQRFRLTASLSRSIMVAASLARQHQQPGLTEQDALLSSLGASLGQALVQELRQISMQRHIIPVFSTIDLPSALFPVLDALEHVGIPCALSGSLARSIYGMQRTITQIDVLADLTDADATLLQELLPTAFYVRFADIQAALAAQSSFVFSHLPSLFTIRITFPRKDLNELAMLTRARRLTLREDLSAVSVLTPEDVSVLTLREIQQAEAELARKGRREEPDDLWNELLGVLKVQAPELDLLQIEQHAHTLGLSPWVQRAFEDAGLKH